MKRLEKHKHITDLTDQEMVQLREEIVLNSQHYDDYENSLGVPAVEAFHWFDGYIRDVYDAAVRDGVTNEQFGKDFYGMVDKYDTDDFLLASFHQWQEGLKAV